MPHKIKKKIKLEEIYFPKKLKFSDFDIYLSPSQTRKMSQKKNKILKIIDEQHDEMKSESQDKATGYNKDFIRILGELNDIMLKQGEPFRAKAYQRAQDSIIKFKDNITNPDKQLKGLPGIGTTILTKLNEFIKTGTLAILERERMNPLNLLTQIYGIGPKKAKELIELDITTIDELKQHKDLLNEKQLIGLKYYDDIMKRIPRPEIEDFKEMFTTIFNSVAPTGSTFEIVGSYRRGAQNSGDIDIIISNSNNNKDVFDKVLNKLIQDKIIVEVLSRGKTKSLTIANVYPGKSKPSFRRVDFLYSSPEEYPFAIFYFTGSKIFNTIVRQRALDLGFTLNEHGISHIKDKIKGSIVEHIFPDEISIFEFLGIKYKEPHERIDGTSVEILEKITPKKKEESISSSHNTTIKKSKISPLLSTSSLISKFQKEGISALKIMTEDELSKIIRAANEAYHCENKLSIISDNEYDIIREHIINKYPKNESVHEGHTKCDIEKDNIKVNLPYELWSMDKLKPTTDAVNKWTKKYSGPYVVSAKLDGLSGLYVSEGGEPKFYTRGNGKKGTDISALIPVLIGKKPDIPVAIRGEIIVTKEIFEKKYSKKYSSPRDFVKGIINSKIIDPAILRDIDFVPYEVITPVLKPSEQFEFLNKLWDKKGQPKTVKYINEKTVSNERLSELLLDWRISYKYAVDGIIVVNDQIYDRPKKNPEYAFAFKMVISDQIAEAKVVDVIWTPSKDGYLKPRVQIEPISLVGAKIEYATGFNAKFIVDNRIGIGALIRIIRSGDVIPHIESIVTPAEKVSLPDVPYKWNETNVDIILDNKQDDITVREKNITGFFKGLEVEGLGPGNVKKLVAGGYDTVPKIIAMTKKDFLKIEGFKEKLATKIYEGIKKSIGKATLPELMAATNIFGRGMGERRFKAILKSYPDILLLENDKEEKIKKLIKVEGFAKKTAEKFVEGIVPFIEFINEANLEDKLIVETYDDEEIASEDEHELAGKKIVLTGFRDKSLIEKIKSIGAELGDSVTKNTFIVLVKDKEEDTGKADQARHLKIPLLTPDEFLKKYQL